MSRIIMDVTQLAHRTGKITGIPRVMDELAKRFRKSGNGQVMFVSWVASQQEFYEIDFEQTLVQRKGVIYKQRGSGATGQVVTEDSSLSAIQRSSFLRRAAKKGLVAAKRINPRLAENIESQATKARMSQYDAVTFSNNDIFLIPWGEWWSPAFAERLLVARQEGAKIVQIIHDIGPTVWPQFFEQLEINPTTYNAKILPICSLVLAVSQNTKRELIEWLKQNKLFVPRIEVFRLGDDLQVSKPIKPADPVFKKSCLQGGDFLLCVGTVEAKKNHQLFYYVYKLARARGIDLPKLVIVGRRGYQTESVINIMTNDPEVKDKFVFLFDASDEELSWLYDHCKFTILPSFHEGWGIPIAESLARGVPSLCSNTSSMVEIAEGVVGHFSPASPDECLVGIQAWLSPEKLEVARKKAKTYKQFSWDQSFKQVDGYLAGL
jgi:glycosyltransferase involved in cell wall biosynthesis